MLYDIIQDDKFSQLMKKQIGDMLSYLFDKEQNFGILCKIEHVSFEPKLPKKIEADFKPMTLFFLAGYTYDSAILESEHIVFEAGFGPDNIGSFVRVPLLSIMQIIIDETPIFVNLATPKAKPSTKQMPNHDAIKNSMQSFLSNPENSKFLKK